MSSKAYRRLPHERNDPSCKNGFAGHHKADDRDHKVKQLRYVPDGRWHGCLVLEAVILGRWLQKGIAGGHEKRLKPVAATHQRVCGQDGLALLRCAPAQDDLPTRFLPRTHQPRCCSPRPGPPASADTRTCCRIRWPARAGLVAWVRVPGCVCTPHTRRQKVSRFRYWISSNHSRFLVSASPIVRPLAVVEDVRSLVDDEVVKMGSPSWKVGQRERSRWFPRSSPTILGASGPTEAHLCCQVQVRQGPMRCGPRATEQAPVSMFAAVRKTSDFSSTASTASSRSRRKQTTHHGSTFLRVTHKVGGKKKEQNSSDSSLTSAPEPAACLPSPCSPHL